MRTPSSTRNFGYEPDASRLTRLLGSASFTFTLLFALPAMGQAYPVKPVRVIVAQVPGGASDLLMRTITQKLADTLSQQFIVDNRPGAGGNIGAEIAAKAAPDGYTLFMVSAPHVIAPSLYRKLSYDISRDFSPITLIGSEALCATVHPSLPIKSIREFVAFLKKRPGEVSYGSTGNGAVNHLATELFKSKAGVDMVHVPYKGSAFAIPDAISGRIQVLFANVSPLTPHIKAGKLRPVSSLKDVPTIAESGYPDYEAINWFGLVAPARTPQDVLQKLNDAIRKTINLPEIRAYYERRGADSMTSTPEEMRSFMQKEAEKWAAIVRASDARID